jgi:1-acyl-sn-glycerol-3-phosphate acyltransferase
MGTPTAVAAPPATGTTRWQPPRAWRIAMRASLMIIAPVCRLRVTSDMPDELRDGPIVLAANHIGAFDPVVLVAACARMGLAPRMLAEGGLFEAPVLGATLRAFGHVPVDRKRRTVLDALPAASAALESGAVILAYPEGRITLDPGMWPENGKSGLARLAVTTNTQIVPVAQWGAHLIMPWGAPKRLGRRLLWAMVRRPIVRVHFGAPVPLDDLRPETTDTDGQIKAREVRSATDRIIDAITDELMKVRRGEPRLPAWIDPFRPLTTSRTHRYRGHSGWPPIMPPA